MAKFLRLGIAVLFAVSAFAQMQQGPGGPRGGRGFGGRGQGVAGTITQKKADSLSLQTPDGKTATIKLTPDTRFRREGQPASLDDFKVGDRVFVAGEKEGDTWKALVVGTGRGGMMNREMLGKRFIAGEVTKIEDTKLTIRRVDGEVQVIAVDESTSFHNDKRESITLADIKVGDKVAGRGEVKNGVFVPAVLNVGGMQRFPDSGAPDRQDRPK